jgi:hypothetical protein
VKKWSHTLFINPWARGVKIQICHLSANCYNKLYGGFRNLTLT